jgi:hypothetical protein
MRKNKLKKLASLVLLALLLLSSLLQPSAAQAQTDPIPGAVAYLQANQQADGGITGFSGTSDPDTTARAVLGLAANGLAVDALLSADGLSPLDYLQAQAASYTHDENGLLYPGRAGLWLAAMAVGAGIPAQPGNLSLLDELEATFHWSTGDYSTAASGGYASGAASDLSQAWALLGLSLAGQPVPVEAAGYLLGTQAPDGSWGSMDPDTTALAVIALLATGHTQPTDPAVTNALIFFHRTQLANGGWRPSWDTDPLNADSTAWILQALYAAGEDLSTWAATEGDPLSALAGLQKPDGSLGGTYANTYSTAEALLGLAGRPLMEAALPLQPNRAGVVVQFAEGRVATACVRFPEASLTGYDLLVRSGLLVTSLTDPSLGTAVCGIENTGCPVEDCFCAMPAYWSYWEQGPSGWEYAVTGAAQTQVTYGSVNAWSWGEGVAPPPYSFQNLCPYGNAPVGLEEDVVTAIPAVEPPAVTATLEPEPSATTPPTLAPTVADEALPTITPADGVSDEADKPASGAGLLFFAVLMLGLGIGLSIVRKRRRPR